MSKITVKGCGSFKTRKGTRLLDCLVKRGLPVIATCGGKGRCGSCRVRIKGGQKHPDELDRLFMPQSLLKQGYRLACQYRVMHDLTIEIPGSKKPEYVNHKSNRGLALDIGTTVIKGAIVNLETGNIEKISRIYNLQNSMGGDVLTRVGAAINGQYRLLNKLLLSSIKKLKKCLGVNKPAITMVIGNPVMLSFYLYQPVQGFAHYPFRSPFKKGIFLKNPPRYVFPIIGGFVGGDTISGIIASRMLKKNQNNLYIDLGTNGEVALVQDEKIFAASTAAGPAFEGIGIGCGSLAVPGAIDRVSFSKGTIKYHTIDNKKPIGICASGLIDLLNVLLERNILKNNGRIKHDMQIAQVNINQDDIRKLQLAIGAIHSGIKILLHKAKITSKQIDKAVITGEFGSKLNVGALERLGLLPKGVKKVTFEKNLAIQGAIMAIRSNRIFNQIETIRKLSKHIDLASQPDFQQVFVAALNFAPWD